MHFRTLAVCSGLIQPPGGRMEDRESDGDKKQIHTHIRQISETCSRRKQTQCDRDKKQMQTKS